MLKFTVSKGYNTTYFNQQLIHQHKVLFLTTLICVDNDNRLH